MSGPNGDVVAAVAGLRADGPHAVEICLPKKLVNTQLKEIGRWLVEWHMPHSIRLIPERGGEIYAIEVRFPDEKHARAFAYQFERTFA